MILFNSSYQSGIFFVFSNWGLYKWCTNKFTQQTLKTDNEMSFFIWIFFTNQTAYPRDKEYHKANNK